MTRVAFMTIKKQEDSTIPYSHDSTDIRTYIVKDDKKFQWMIRCVMINTLEGRALLEEIAVKLGVIELEHSIDSISVVWDTEKIFEAKKK